MHKFVRMVREMTERGKVSYEDEDLNGAVKKCTIEAHPSRQSVAYGACSV